MKSLPTHDIQATENTARDIHSYIDINQAYINTAQLIKSWIETTEVALRNIEKLANDAFKLAKSASNNNSPKTKLLEIKRHLPYIKLISC